jgi:hypothetical protein
MSIAATPSKFRRPGRSMAADCAASDPVITLGKIELRVLSAAP